MARRLPPLWSFLVGASLVACGSTGGIHARMGYSEAGGLRVAEVPEDGPAARAGLREGDRIMAIDGEPVRGLGYQAIVELLRGRVGSEVTLEVIRDGEIVRIDVERAAYRR